MKKYYRALRIVLAVLTVAVSLFVLTGVLIQAIGRVFMAVSYLFWFDRRSAKCEWYEFKDEVIRLWKE